MIVQGYASLTDNKTTVNISLKSYEDREDCWRDSPNWTGTGAYYLFLTIDNMDGTSEPQYFYSAGQPILSNMSSGVKKYNFNDEYPTTTVDLSQFAIPGD
jgi:hypothetical protein